MAASPIISLIDIRKSYRQGEFVTHVLQGITLDIYPGEYVCIMGPSGCGKSTLLNMLGGLDQPTSGKYILGGEDIATLNDDELSHARCSKLGFIFQSYNLIQQLSVLENIEVPMYYKGMKDSEMRPIAERLAEKVGLSHRLHHKPTELSGGQQQRVAIARAIVNDPVLILGDEPTGNLDSRTSEEIMALFQDLNRNGKTVVIVTHEEEIARHCKRIIRFKDGRIQLDEPVKDPIDAREAIRHLPDPDAEIPTPQPEPTAVAVPRFEV